MTSDHSAATAAEAGRSAPTGVVLACVAASGAAVTIVELTAVRVFQPYFGSTTPVWTNVIATSLAALACGYLLGGRLADRRPRPAVLLSLLTAAGVLATLAAAFATAVARRFLADG